MNIQKDKIYHFITCMMISIAVTLILHLCLTVEYDRAVSFGTLSAFAAGFVKEFYDKYVKKTKFDTNDIIADILGIFAAVVFLCVLGTLTNISGTNG